MIPSNSSNKLPPRGQPESSAGHSELLLRLLDYFPRSPEPVQEAIRRLFSSFTLEEMARNAESWEERMLHNAAHIIQVIDPLWTEKFASISSPSPLSAAHVPCCCCNIWGFPIPSGCRDRTAS